MDHTLRGEKQMSDSAVVSGMPLVDTYLVKVTRCKDCRFGWTNAITGDVYCQRDGRHSHEMVFDPDAFCSYGKPRESKEE